MEKQVRFLSRRGNLQLQILKIELWNDLFRAICSVFPFPTENYCFFIYIWYWQETFLYLNGMEIISLPNCVVTVNTPMFQLNTCTRTIWYSFPQWKMLMQINFTQIWFTCGLNKLFFSGSDNLFFCDFCWNFHVYSSISIIRHCWRKLAQKSKNFQMTIFYNSWFYDGFGTHSKSLPFIKKQTELSKIR